MNFDQPKKSTENRTKEIEDVIKAFQKKDEHSERWMIRGTDAAQSLWQDLYDADRPDHTFLTKHYKKFREILESKLQGKTLVDLGVGPSENILTPEVANSLGIKKYIAIDEDLQVYPHDENYKENDPISDEVAELKSKKIEVITKQEDMLRFVASLKDNSANFLISAVDEIVISDKKYWEYLGEEISRATEKGGIVVAVQDVPIGKYLKNFKMLSLLGEGALGGWDTKIYEKL